jgi:hypothetical protein
LLEKCFKDTEAMDYKRFLFVCENVCSDIYLFLLVFLLQNKPFTNSALGEYEKQKNTFLKVSSNHNLSVTGSPGKLLASPNLNSKFSPSVTISKSPVLTSSPQTSAFRLDGKKEESKNLLLKMAGIGLSKTDDIKRTDTKSKTVQQNVPININLVGPTVPVNRKIRNNLKNIDEIKPMEKDFSKMNFEDLQILPATKVSNTSVDKMDVDDEYEEDGRDIILEGHLYKITDDKQIKRLWFKLVNRDLYCNLLI